MSIESIIIKLNRSGAGISPGYSLTIYGNGTVIYEGKENVKVKGKIESNIDKDKVLALLSDFKESGVFSLEANYMTEESQEMPYTIISFSMPSKSGETLTKKIAHYDKDENVPNELISLEDKIDSIVDSKKWIDDSPETDIVKQDEKVESVEKTDGSKKSKSPKKKKRKKILSIAILLFFIVLLFVYFIYPNLVGTPSKDDTTTVVDLYGNYYIEEGENLEILSLTTASNVEINESNPNPVTYTVASDFNVEDRVWIYHEIANFSILTNKTNSNKTCDVLLKIKIVNNSLTYHSDNHIRENIGKGIEIWYFDTNDDWNAGIYTVEVVITDKVNDNTVSESIDFSLN